MKKTSNIIWGIVLVAIGIIFGLNALGITDIDLFFSGWWTLFIIIPCSIGIIKDYRKIGNYIGLLIGVVLLLSAQGLLDISKIGNLIFPAILVIIGLGMIFKDTVSGKASEKIKELNKTNKDEYYATFSGQKLKFAGDEFKGASLNSIFGGIDLDLTECNFTQDQVINATSVFGGTNIIIPNNVNVKVVSNSIFGGVSNRKKEKVENAPTIYVKAFCLFGGVEIK